VTRTTRADRKVLNRSPTSVATPTVALAPRQIRRDAARARPTGLLPHRAQRINADSARDHDPRSARLASPASRRAPGRPFRSPMRSSSPIAVTAATVPLSQELRKCPLASSAPGVFGDLWKEVGGCRGFAFMPRRGSAASTARPARRGLQGRHQTRLCCRCPAVVPPESLFGERRR
jgi:hypothetical protein